MEKRHFRRAEFGTRGVAGLADGSVAFELIDVSLRGALIHPHESSLLRIGSYATLSIELPGSTEQITAEAECVHREHEYFGFRFTVIDIDSITHLRRLIELNTPEDGDLDRELAFLARSRDS